MKLLHPSVKKLLKKYREIVVLNRINATLGYDLNVSMPKKGAGNRGDQIAYITGLISDQWQDSEFKTLLNEIDETSLSEVEHAVIRNLKHLGKVYFKVPRKVIVKLTETTTKAYPIWHQAKTDNNFQLFLPHLVNIIELNREIATHLEYDTNPYDALLDQYEPGLTSEECTKLFKNLKYELSILLKKIQKSALYSVENYIVGGDIGYPLELQKQLANYIAKLLGYDFDMGRLDTSSHPFTETLGRYDVRITTRYKAHDFRESLTSTIHEVGHALYEQNVDPDYEYTPLDGGVFLGIHESQSRFWENQIGRNPLFLKFLLPILQAFFPEQLQDVDHMKLVRLLNEVKPSCIRTESDEVTYNLHIALRFEIENDLINGRLQARDVPEAWRRSMENLFGIVPETDRVGVLQDVHWAHGSFGYFPTYTLGTLAASQITESLKKEVDYEECLRNGAFGPIGTWLSKTIHSHGSMYTPQELIKKVTGKDLSSKPFLEYINHKYTSLYEL